MAALRGSHFEWPKGFPQLNAVSRRLIHRQDVLPSK